MPQNEPWCQRAINGFCSNVFFVAPVSWLAAKDVHEGREELNFSTWNNYDARKQVKLMHESWEQVEEGEMPLWFYTPLHRDAKLSATDKSLLRQWALGSGSVEMERTHDTTPTMTRLMGYQRCFLGASL